MTSIRIRACRCDELLNRALWQRAFGSPLNIVIGELAATHSQSNHFETSPLPSLRDWRRYDRQTGGQQRKGQWQQDSYPHMDSRTDERCLWIIWVLIGLAAYNLMLTSYVEFTRRHFGWSYHRQETVRRRKNIQRRALSPPPPPPQKKKTWKIQNSNTTQLGASGGR